MKLEELLTGTRLELELLDNLGEKVGHTYISQLLEPVRETGMVISAPIFESRLIFVPLNSTLQIAFFHRKHGLMGFTATVNAREYRGNIAILLIQAESEPEKIQRRKHYRLDSLLNAEFKVLDVSSDKPFADSFTKATVKNISGSGCCIITDENVPNNSVVDLYVYLNTTTKIRALCVVLRNHQVEVKKGISYDLGLHFADISAKDQDLIIRYIFEQQRMLLKRDVLGK
jgi:c-di-GMP-binding flagellar brake protein YcgR